MASPEEIEEEARRRERDLQHAVDIDTERAQGDSLMDFFALLFEAFNSFLNDLLVEEDPYLNADSEDREEIDRRSLEDSQRYGDRRGEARERFTPARITADNAELYRMRQDYERRYGGRVEAVSPVHDGNVNSLRGMRFHPIHHEDRMHEGVDIVGSSEIHSAMPGIVVYTGWRGGYGNTIEIMDIYGVRHRYAHLSDINVEIGQRIDIDQQIGVMGRTGGATGVHLHYEQIDARGNRRDPHVQGESINRRGELPDTHQHAHGEDDSHEAATQPEIEAPTTPRDPVSRTRTQ